MLRSVPQCCSLLTFTCASPTLNLDVFMYNPTADRKVSTRRRFLSNLDPWSKLLLFNLTQSFESKCAITIDAVMIARRPEICGSMQVEKKHKEDHRTVLICNITAYLTYSNTTIHLPLVQYMTSGSIKTVACTHCGLIRGKTTEQ